MEFIFRGSLGSHLAGSDKLRIELLVKYGEDAIEYQADAEQCGAESQRGDNGPELTVDKGRNPHHGKHAETGDSHLDTHGQGHFLALEPLGKGLGNRCAGHFTATAENHEAQ